MKLSMSPLPAPWLETVAVSALAVIFVLAGALSLSTDFCCCSTLFFFFFFFLLNPIRGLVCTSSGPKVMEEEAAIPFKVFVGLVSRLGLAPGFGRWVAGPLRFENTFKLSKNKGEMENCSVRNLLIQAPHVWVNLDINQGRFKSEGRFWKLKTRSINQSFPHKILNICGDELPEEKRPYFCFVLVWLVKEPFVIISVTRSLGALRDPPSSWRPFRSLDSVLCALWALRPCDSRNNDWIVR